MTNEEKRAAPRVPFVLRVNYPNQENCFDATENLSRGGLFIQTDQAFEVGQRVPLSLSFPGLMDPIELVGRVAWIRPSRGEVRGGIGICAEREEDRKRLEALLERFGTQKKVDINKLPKAGFKVLIVEDNPHIIEMYQYVLKKLAESDLKGEIPLGVEFANDGADALKRLLSEPHHLVITDLFMPGVDGFNLVEQIRAEPKLTGLPVVVISAGGFEAQQKAFYSGVDIFLRKPVRFVEVLETVKQLLRIR